MLNEQGFDLWADGYDQSVSQAEEGNAYPFAGYRNVLGQIYDGIRRTKGSRILDIGFGTGTLTQKLYQDGYEVSGIDFSDKMIGLAQQAMPMANLIHHDFTLGLPEELEGAEFDCIVSTYAFHHLNDAEKVCFLHELLGHLSESGRIFIGDVAFETRIQLDQCRNQYESQWDDEEFYPVADELMLYFRKKCFRFKPVSHCAGVFTLVKKAVYLEES